MTEIWREILYFKSLCPIFSVCTETQTQQWNLFALPSTFHVGIVYICLCGSIHNFPCFCADIYCDCKAVWQTKNQIGILDLRSKGISQCRCAVGGRFVDWFRLLAFLDSSLTVDHVVLSWYLAHCFLLGWQYNLFHIILALLNFL